MVLSKSTGCSTLLLLLLRLARPCAAASDAMPHYHRGVLRPYEIGPPQILLSTHDERRLQCGHAVLQALAAEDESRRVIMVRDVRAPSHIVLSRILDYERYDRMVEGVDSCVNYASYADGTTQTVKSKYEISALHLKLKYYVKHVYDPTQRCMVFSLDYDRRSDLEDTVGYWFVQPSGRDHCRVFYSCECKLRGWTPAPVLNLLQKEALKMATTWVNEESLKEWHASRACAANNAAVRFVQSVRGSVQNIRGSVDSLSARSPWLASRRRAAVRFVSNVRPDRSKAFPIA